MFVMLDNLIEGLVHISTLNGYYNYVPEQLSLVSNDRRNRYRVGDKVKVIVTRASKESGQIDFELVDDGDQNGDKKQESVL